MKSIFWVFTVCLPTSVFAGEIWCTDKAVWGSTVPDSGYSIRMGMLEGNGQYFPLVDRLFLSLQTLNQKIVVTVGKSGSPDATWSPIASTEGNQEVDSL